MNKIISIHSILLKASPAEVWDVLTNPEKIALYLFGTQTETDWRIGSSIQFSGEFQGMKYSDKGIVMANVANKLLAYDYWTQFSGLEDIPENYCEVSYQIESVDEGSVKLIWQQIGFKDKDSLTRHESGMPSIMESIKKIVEGYQK